MDIASTEKPVIGIAIVMLVTEVVMQLTPKGFDKKRFAVPISMLIAVIMSIVDTFIYSSGMWYKLLWEAGLKGFVMAMGAGGAYSAMRNSIGNGQ